MSWLGVAKVCVDTVQGWLGLGVAKVCADELAGSVCC